MALKGVAIHSAKTHRSLLAAHGEESLSVSTTALIKGTCPILVFLCHRLPTSYASFAQEAGVHDATSRRCSDPHLALRLRHPETHLL